MSVAEKMSKVIESLKKHFQSMRTNRANPDMLHGIQVEYYGTMTSLQSLASISVPENMVLLLTVFDKGAVKSIEKAILQANLGLNPSIDGGLVRLRLPELTGERRLELVKQIKKMGEESKISIRNIRRDAVDEIKKNKELAEDESKKEQAHIQSITDDRIALIDKLLTEKEKEILAV